MDSFFSRYKNALVLTTVLLVQVIGLAVQVRRPTATSAVDTHNVRLLRYWAVSAVSPLEKLFLRMGHGVRNAWEGYVDLRHVRQQDRELKDELNRIRIEQAALSSDARQGQRLQELLAFKEQYIYKTVAAQVMGTSGSDQSRVLYIDKGAADGLRAEMPVITPDGIVGKVREVFPHSAQVLQINDITSGAGVILQSTRIRGILRGNAVGQPQIINLLPDERIKAGERVLTSGGDQVFPRGLPVGQVQSIKPDPDHDPYIAVTVKPAADLTRLEEVLVITDVQAQMPPGTQQDLLKSESVAADAAKTADVQKAADALAQRLPGITQTNANAPDLLQANDATQNGTARDANGQPVPLKPLPAEHPDRYTPGAAPSATDLEPGAQVKPSTDALLGHGGTQSTPAVPAATAATIGSKPAKAPAAGTSGTGTRTPGTTTPGTTTTGTPNPGTTNPRTPMPRTPTPRVPTPRTGAMGTTGNTTPAGTAKPKTSAPATRPPVPVVRPQTPTTEKPQP